MADETIELKNARLIEENERLRAHQLNMARGRENAERKKRAKKTAKVVKGRAPKVTKAEGSLMVIVMLIAFDIPQILISFIPFIGWIIAGLGSILGWFIVYLWMASRGISIFSSGKRVSSTLISVFGETIIPALPALSLFVLGVTINENWRKIIKK